MEGPAYQRIRRHPLTESHDNLARWRTNGMIGHIYSQEDFVALHPHRPQSSGANDGLGFVRAPVISSILKYSDMRPNYLSTQNRGVDT